MLRQAPNEQKAELLVSLKSASCVNADLCELQRLCVEGYSQHIAALSDTARAKSLLKNGGSDAEAAQALNLASTELRAAAPTIARCADAQGAAHRSYKF